MGYFIFKRSIQSLFSLVALVILVFFLSRLTGSPADLYLPQDATEAMRQQILARAENAYTVSAICQYVADTSSRYVLMPVRFAS